MSQLLLPDLGVYLPGGDVSSLSNNSNTESDEGGSSTGMNYDPLSLSQPMASRLWKDLSGAELAVASVSYITGDEKKNADFANQINDSNGAPFPDLERQSKKRRLLARSETVQDGRW